MPRQERAKSGTGIYHVMLGMKNDGTFGAIDDLTVTYDGNRLMKVTDDAEAVNGNHRDRFLILRNNKQQIATFKQIE